MVRTQALSTSGRTSLSQLKMSLIESYNRSTPLIVQISIAVNWTRGTLTLRHTILTLRRALKSLLHSRFIIPLKRHTLAINNMPKIIKLTTRSTNSIDETRITTYRTSLTSTSIQHISRRTNRTVRLRCAISTIYRTSSSYSLVILIKPFQWNTSLLSSIHLSIMNRRITTHTCYFVITCEAVISTKSTFICHFINKMKLRTYTLISVS